MTSSLASCFTQQLWVRSMLATEGQGNHTQKQSAMVNGSQLESTWVNVVNVGQPQQHESTWISVGQRESTWVNVSQRESTWVKMSQRGSMWDSISNASQLQSTSTKTKVHARAIYILQLKFFNITLGFVLVKFSVDPLSFLCLNMIQTIVPFVPFSLSHSWIL